MEKAFNELLEPLSRPQNRIDGDERAPLRHGPRQREGRIERLEGNWTFQIKRVQ